MRKNFLVILLALAAAFLLSTCGANNRNEVAFPVELFQVRIPGGGDPNQMSCDVFLESVEVRKDPFDPKVFLLELKGSLSTSCENLQVIAGEPNPRNEITITFGATGMRRPSSSSRVSTIALKPYYISLPLKNVEGGETYLITISSTNEEKTFEFTLEE